MRVGIAGVPAGHLRVVVKDVADVPAEDDVAEAEAAFEGRAKLVDGDVFAAQDAVDVEPADLGAGDASVLEVFQKVLHIGHG